MKIINKASDMAGVSADESIVAKTGLAYPLTSYDLRQEAIAALVRYINLRSAEGAMYLEACMSTVLEDSKLFNAVEYYHLAEACITLARINGLNAHYPRLPGEATI